METEMETELETEIEIGTEIEIEIEKSKNILKIYFRKFRNWDSNVIKR
jgi:hypothetical protein